MTPEERFLDVIKYAYEADVIGVDTEGTGLSVLDGRDYCMGVGIAYRVPVVGIIQKAYFPFRHNLKYDLPGVDNLPMYLLEPLKHLLENKRIVCHNMKYDKPALKTLGIEINDEWFCSLLMHHMTNENVWSQQLHYLTNLLFKEEPAKSTLLKAFVDKFGWPNVPISLAEEFCPTEAETSLRVLEYCIPILRKEEQINLWPDQIKFVNTLLRMESYGVRINQELCSDLAIEAEKRMVQLIEQLGFDPGSTKELTSFLFNTLGLPILQVGKPSKSWPEGRPSLDKKIMIEYDEMLNVVAGTNPVARNVLEFRQHQKARSTWYEGFPNKLSPDGRLRSNFKVHGTKTGRLSSSEPNLQQLPRAGKSTSANRRVRSLLVPADGFKLYEYDYAQLELRIGVLYANEKSLITLFDEGRDFFTELTLVAFPGRDPYDTNPSTGNDYRHDIKTYFYARQYGAGLEKQAVLLQMEVHEVRLISERIDNAYPGFRRASDLCRDKAKNSGFIRYWTGRRRHFNYWDDRYHKAFNSVMQGGAAEIVKYAMIRVDELTKDADDCRMLLQVHDSIITEEMEGTHEIWEPLIKNAMIDFPQFGIKFDVDCHEWGSK